MDASWQNILWGPIANSGLGQQATYQPTVYDSIPDISSTLQQPQSYINEGGSGDGGRFGGSPLNASSVPNDGSWNYLDGEWWGNLGFVPETLTAKKTLQSYAPLIGSVLNNPIQGIASAMTLNPINDPALKTAATEYLEAVNSPLSWNDFVQNYKSLTKASTPARMNMTDTIRGMLMGLNPAFSEMYNTAITEDHMNPHEFAGFVDSLTRSGLDPTSVSPLDQTSARLGTVPSAAYDYARALNFDTNLTDAPAFEGFNQSAIARAEWGAKIDNMINSIGQDLSSNYDSGGSSGGGGYGSGLSDPGGDYSNDPGGWGYGGSAYEGSPAAGNSGNGGGSGGSDKNSGGGGFGASTGSGGTGQSDTQGGVDSEGNSSVGGGGGSSSSGSDSDSDSDSDGRNK